MNSLQTLIVDSKDSFHELEGEWRSLWADSFPCGTIFSSFDWYRCWWNHFGDARKKLFLIVIKDHEKVSAIAPLMLENRQFRSLPVRVACFIENGNSLHNDFCLSTAIRRPLLSAMLDGLMNHSDLWDMIELKNIPDNNENIQILIELAKERGITCEVKPALDSPYIAISCDWEPFYAGCSSRTRKTHRNLFNTISKAGQYRLILVTTFQEYENYRAAIMDVAANSWTAGVGDCLASPRNREFFEDISRVAAENGWLDLWLLEFNGRIIAFEYHLRCNGRNHALRASYHEEYAHLSPGAVLDLLVMKELFNDHARVYEYDLGGSFDSYKKKWTPLVRAHKIIQMFKPEIYSRILHGVEYGVVPILKRGRTVLNRLSANGSES